MYKESTPEAKLLRSELEKLGVRVLSEVNDGFKHIDLALPDAKINIEIDHINLDFDILKLRFFVIFLFFPCRFLFQYSLLSFK